MANYHSVPHEVAARVRSKVTMSDQHLSAHSHGQASEHSEAMWRQVAPASSFFFSQSHQIYRNHGENTTVLSNCLFLFPFSPTSSVHRLQAGTNGCLGTLCACM